LEHGAIRGVADQWKTESVQLLVIHGISRWDADLEDGGARLRPCGDHATNRGIDAANRLAETATLLHLRLGNRDRSFSGRSSRSRFPEVLALNHTLGVRHVSLHAEWSSPVGRLIRRGRKVQSLRKPGSARAEPAWCLVPHHRQSQIPGHHPISVAGLRDDSGIGPRARPGQPASTSGRGARIYAFRPESWGGRSAILLPSIDLIWSARLTLRLSRLKLSSMYHRESTATASVQIDISS